MIYDGNVKAEVWCLISLIDNCTSSCHPFDSGQTTAYIKSEFCTDFNRKSRKEIPAYKSSCGTGFYTKQM